MPQQNTRGGSGAARADNSAVRAGFSIGWPQERWAGIFILLALGLLILIRVGFRGIGVSGSVAGKVSV